MYDRATGEPADLHGLTPEAIEDLEFEMSMGDDAPEVPRRYRKRPSDHLDRHLIRRVVRRDDGTAHMAKAYPLRLLTRRLGTPRARVRRMIERGDLPGHDLILGTRPAWSEDAARLMFDRLGHDFDAARAEAHAEAVAADPAPDWIKRLRTIYPAEEPCGRLARLTHEHERQETTYPRSPAMTSANSDATFSRPHDPTRLTSPSNTPATLMASPAASTTDAIGES